MLTNSEITFMLLESRYGEITAYSYLEQIERAAGLSPAALVGEDPQLRLANAFRLQDAKRKANTTPVAYEPALLMAA